MRHFRLLLGIVIMLLITVADLNAAIYKWIDENSNIVYSGTRPPSGNKSLNSPSLPPTPRPIATTTLPFSTSAKKQSAAAKQDKTVKKEKSALEVACERLRNNLTVMNSSDKIYEKDSQGVRKFLTATERKERIRSTERRIREECPLISQTDSYAGSR
ncbi:hypothetical protein BOW40_10825 [Solemya velum gill symbiont]|nr:hypothetical protein BOW38_10750 [Solemya velum gill symbiont]OOZ50021.1 hypothetical protein BOW40_10825 [Solemya velum gill symbiont]